MNSSLRAKFFRLILSISLMGFALALPCRAFGKCPPGEEEVEIDNPNYKPQSSAGAAPATNEPTPDGLGAGKGGDTGIPLPPDPPASVAQQPAKIKSCQKIGGPKASVNTQAPTSQPGNGTVQNGVAAAQQFGLALALANANALDEQKQAAVKAAYSNLVGSVAQVKKGYADGEISEKDASKVQTLMMAALAAGLANTAKNNGGSKSTYVWDDSASNAATGSKTVAAAPAFVAPSSGNEPTISVNQVVNLGQPAAATAPSGLAWQDGQRTQDSGGIPANAGVPLSAANPLTIGLSSAPQTELTAEEKVAALAPKNPDQLHIRASELFSPQSVYGKTSFAYDGPKAANKENLENQDGEAGSSESKLAYEKAVQERAKANQKGGAASGNFLNGILEAARNAVGMSAAGYAATADLKPRIKYEGLPGEKAKTRSLASLNSPAMVPAVEQGRDESQAAFSSATLTTPQRWSVGGLSALSAAFSGLAFLRRRRKQRRRL